MAFDSPDYHTLQTFVARVTEGKECDSGVVSCDAPAPGPRLLRRLSRSEYDATIQDLFAIQSVWGASFTTDIVVNGFDNNAAARRVTPLLADQTRKAAEAIAKAVILNPGLNVPCAVATGDAVCAGKLIDSLGKRAFRRPLTGASHARYLALYDLVAKDEGFTGGAEAVIAAMLQSPSFLYRTELGDAAQPAGAAAIKLTPYEVASELSYFLWGTMPDAALFAAADAGELGTPAQIEAQARRLLADPRSRKTIQHFIEAWLEIDRLSNIPKDAATYPELDAAARLAQREETRRFVTNVMEKGTGTLPELLTSRTSFLSPELAKLYGLPAPTGPKDAEGFAETSFAGTARAGELRVRGHEVKASHATFRVVLEAVLLGIATRTRVTMAAACADGLGSPPMSERSKVLSLSSTAPRGAFAVLALALTMPACGGAVMSGAAVGKIGQGLSEHATAMPQGAEVCALQEALSAPMPGAAEKPTSETCAKAAKSDQLWHRAIVVLGGYGGTLETMAAGSSPATAGQLEGARTGVKDANWIDVDAGQEPAARGAVAALSSQMSANASKGDLARAVSDAAPHVKTLCNGLLPYLETQAKTLAEIEKEAEKRRAARTERRCGAVDARPICVNDSMVDRVAYASLFGQAISLESSHLEAHDAIAGFCAAHVKLADAAAAGTLSKDQTYLDIVEAVKSVRRSQPQVAAASKPAEGGKGAAAPKK